MFPSSSQWIALSDTGTSMINVPTSVFLQIMTILGAYLNTSRDDNVIDIDSMFG